MNKSLLVLLCYVLCCTLLAAQEKPEHHQQPNQQEEEQRPRVDDGSIKLFLEKIQVTGQLEKPQAVFIIPGNNPEIDDIQIDRSFFKKIFRPVEKKGRIINKPATKSKERHDYIPW